jgi:starch phosphorylase
MTSPVAPFTRRTRIAYFSMEIALRPEMHTYAGGLGVLAGDTARSCADLELRAVFVTLVSRAGYFRQKIDAQRGQLEEPDWWEPAHWCVALDAMVAVSIEGRPVWIRPWLFVHECPRGSQVPVLLLDTDLDQNSSEDRKLTDHLYGGDEAYRLKQEIVLGLGGRRLLHALGFEIHTYHLNEGHAALLILDLMERYRLRGRDLEPGRPPFDIATIREHCVFTTHTPIEAGHDRFSYQLFEKLLPGFAAVKELKHVAGSDQLNMTQLALTFSGYINGVARRHAETTKQMFPGYRIHAVTNGVHVETWAHEAFRELYQSLCPQWVHEPELLVRALQWSEQEIWRCHMAAKADLVRRVAEVSGAKLDPDIPILGFARRMTGYKRPMLLFSDLNQLTSIASRYPFQIVMAGKAHPHDVEGKELIRKIYQMIDQLRGKVVGTFLPNYDMKIARTLVAGADVWLNTPLPPREASGTSGMKAALNGVLNLSVMDGWWVEACIDNVTGWSIGLDGDSGSDEHHGDALYDKLAGTTLPLYYEQPDRWRWMMKQAIGNIAYYFNSQRMMRRYATEAYLR